MRILVTRLLPGMLVDLQGDPIADPAGASPVFAYELVEVGFVALETPDCVVVGFEGYDWVGFPSDHRLNVRRVSSGPRLEVSDLAYVIADTVSVFGAGSIPKRLKRTQQMAEQE